MSNEQDKPSRAEVFRARLKSTLILWALVVGVFLSGVPWAFWGLISLLTVAGAWEFRSLFARDGADGCRVIGLAVGVLVALFVGADLVRGGSGGVGFEWEMEGLVAVVLLSFCWRFRNGIDGRSSVDAVGDALLGYVYVPILFGVFIFRLLFYPEVDGEVPGAWLVMFMVVAAKFTDMGAYVTGSLIGKHKMAPHLSPAKTWEGFVGALGFAQLAAWGMWWLGGEAMGWIPAGHVFVLGVLIGLVAVAGDLAESILKRSLAVKDSGHLMPGIGGVLDLLDSLCFAAPVTYFYLRVMGLV